jgi:hypothetical protein
MRGMRMLMRMRETRETEHNGHTRAKKKENTDHVNTRYKTKMRNEQTILLL